MATGFQPAAVWHAAQSLLDRMCVVGFAVAPIREPVMWQDTQSCGVPLKIPPTWQASQGTSRCAPVNSKLVVK